MKKLIVCLSLAAFAFSAQAGDSKTCTTKTAADACCPSKTAKVTAATSSCSEKTAKSSCSEKSKAAKRTIKTAKGGQLAMR